MLQASTVNIVHAFDDYLIVFQIEILQIWRNARPTLMTVTWMQIVWIPWAHIPVTVELDIRETDKLAMVRNLPINQPTNKHLMLLMKLIAMEVYFRQIRNFSWIDPLRKTCNEPLSCNENANREKFNSFMTFYQSSRSREWARECAK